MNVKRIFKMFSAILARNSRIYFSHFFEMMSHFDKIGLGKPAGNGGKCRINAFLGAIAVDYSIICLRYRIQL